MNEDGSCPSCERVLVDPARAGAAEAPTAPWHFKLLVLALVVYLGWRLVQAVVWIAS